MKKYSMRAIPAAAAMVAALAFGVQVHAQTSTSMPSGTVTVTPVSIAYTGNVFSRKTHAGVDHDLPLNGTALINGAIQVEPRAIGSGHRIVVPNISTLLHGYFVIATLNDDNMLDCCCRL